MTRKNLLKIAIATSVATFTVLTHHNIEQQKLKHKKQIHIKTVDEVNKEIYDTWFKPLEEIKARELTEKQRQEELKKIEEQKKQQDQHSLSRGGIEEETFILTFYTSLDSENSSAGAVTCTGSKLRAGMVANNVLKLNTKIYLEGYGNVVVADTGGVNFNTRNRLDVFIPRKNGENDYQYKKRVLSMGKIKVKGYIIK